MRPLNSITCRLSLRERLQKQANLIARLTPHDTAFIDVVKGAANVNPPLLQRLRFFGIFASNRIVSGRMLSSRLLEGSSNMEIYNALSW